MKQLKFNVYGRYITIVSGQRGWSVFYANNDGKRRPANDIFIPSHIAEDELEQYLADLCHEWATEKHPEVERLK